MTKFYGKETGLKSKYIAGFGKKYIIYSDGKVYNTFKNRYLKQTMSPTGFLRVNLYYKGKGHIKHVHRLVAESFLYNKRIPHYFIVSHVDGNKLNNSLSNIYLDDRMAEMLPNEIIKRVKGFDKYYVSNMGRVFIIDNQDDISLDKHRLVPQNKSENGYLKVNMINNKGKEITLSVHRLVAEAFIPNPHNKSKTAMKQIFNTISLGLCAKNETTI